MITETNQDRYVFEQSEVRVTGRTAENTLRSGKVDVMHEITPVDSSLGAWKKWVRLDTLFKVTA